jgi:hypothetical protein
MNTAAWMPCKWHLQGSHQDPVFIESTGPTGFAIRRGCSVLAKDGEWEYEPMPSGRDNDFLTRCRYATFDEAVAMYASITK